MFALVYLVDEFSPCVLRPLMIELLKMILLTFSWMVSMVDAVGVNATLGNGYGI